MCVSSTAFVAYIMDTREFAKVVITKAQTGVPPLYAYVHALKSVASGVRTRKLYSHVKYPNPVQNIQPWSTLGLALVSFAIPLKRIMGQARIVPPPHRAQICPKAMGVSKGEFVLLTS